MFEASVYSARRKELMGRMGTGAILFPGSTLVGMNYRANTYPFRQDGSFTYYAGLNTPGLVLDHCPQRPTKRSARREIGRASCRERV